MMTKGETVKHVKAAANMTYVHNAAAYHRTELTDRALETSYYGMWCAIV
jgi:hypothetical protein